MNTYTRGIIAAVIILIGVGGGWYWYAQKPAYTPEEIPGTATSTDPQTHIPVSQNGSGTKGSASNTNDLAVIATQSLTGTWRDKNDAMTFIEFKPNNVLIERNDGVASVGEWFVFTGETTLEVPFELDREDVYVKLTREKEIAYVKVANLTLKDLQLVYMDRPGMMFYTPVQ